MSYPKALLKIGDETFLQCIVRKAASANIGLFLTVTGPDHEAIAQQIPAGVEFLKNENYMQGQISSLIKGIRSLPEDVSGAIVWPVDQPLVAGETVEHLVSVYQIERKALTIPVCRQRKGHPVIYNRSAMDFAVRLQPQQTGKDILAAYADDLSLVEVDDAGVVTDIDTREDYERFIGSTGLQDGQRG